MSFFQTLFGGSRRPDPTRYWGPVAPGSPLPVIDIANRRFGSLEFGKSDLAAAAFLGKPRNFKWRDIPSPTLRYPARGFEISFDDRVFDTVQVAVRKAGIASIDDPWEGHAFPAISGLGKGTLHVDGTTTRADIESHLGPATEVDADEELASLIYDIHGLRLEFEILVATDKVYMVTVGNMMD